LRLIVLAGGVGGELSGSLGGETIGSGVEVGAVHLRDLRTGGDSLERASASVALRLHEPTGILAAWVVPQLKASRVEVDEAGVDLSPPDK
jgi:hypothetical protein